MNQVLEFLAENYIYVAGGSLGIIIILIIIIAIGNKKNKNKVSENVSANDMAAIAPQPITGVEPVQEPSLEAVPPVSTTPVETVTNVAEGVFSNPSAAVEPTKVVEQPTPVEPVASAPVQEVFSSVNAPSTEPVTEAPFVVPSVGESTPSVEPVVQPMPETVAPVVDTPVAPVASAPVQEVFSSVNAPVSEPVVEAPVPEMPAVEPVVPTEPVVETPVEPVASTPVQDVFSPVNAPVSEPVVEAPVPEMPTVEPVVPAVETPVAPATSESTEQFNMASVNTTDEAKKDTSDLEVFNIE